MTDYQKIMDEMKKLYISDERPWIVGYSGGKDSTCVTQMVYNMLLDLEKRERKKTVYIVSSDTLVESPPIEKLIGETLHRIEVSAQKDNLPIVVKRVKPPLNETFWVNLIGRGYPSPNKWFRWCTDRLKIRPMTKFILEQVKENGEVILLLGARKSESGSRAQTLKKYEIQNFKLRKHGTIPGAYVYTPIEDLDFREVWAYLLATRKAPWGTDYHELRTLYRKVKRECPLVVDDKTPPCGGSRFGCWVCTVVKEDKSLTGLIEEGEDWLKPLLEFRNWLKEIRNNPDYRENVRKTDRKRKIRLEKLGKEFVAPEHRGHKMLGPFTFEARHEILRRLLTAQAKVADKGLTLISPEELKAIEMIWIYEGDTISSIADVIGQSKPTYFQSHDSEHIREKTRYLEYICKKEDIPIQLIDRLLLVEKDMSSLSRRVGIYNRLEKIIEEYILNGGAK